MAKKKVAPSKVRAEAALAAVQDDFMKRLRDIDPRFRVELTVRGPSDEGVTANWSDWHDRWRDKGGGWADGFGKAGNP